VIIANVHCSFEAPSNGLSVINFVAVRALLCDSLHSILKKAGREKCGFHIVRRFRASWLRKNRVPWDLEKMWMGHAHKDLTDQYAEQLHEDVKYRREWCDKIGLGFDLPGYSQLS
jgi:hypothetical protein